MPAGAVPSSRGTGQGRQAFLSFRCTAFPVSLRLSPAGGAVFDELFSATRSLVILLSTVLFPFSPATSNTTPHSMLPSISLAALWLAAASPALAASGKAGTIEEAGETQVSAMMVSTRADLEVRLG